MRQPHPSFYRTLRIIAVLSLIAPAIVFGFAAFQNWRNIQTQAEERLNGTLDVLQEHALKAFQTVDRAISEVNEVFRDVPDDKIRASESNYHDRLRRTQHALPQVESIWAFDKDGHPLVSSTIFPVPRNLDNSDRSYFSAQKQYDAGSFVGEVVRARVGTSRFFVISGRRTGDLLNSFNGVIGITLTPEHFSGFYRKLSRGARLVCSYAV